MTTEAFNQHIVKMYQLSEDTLIAKAKEYATEDRLHNFKIAGPLQGQTPVGALGGMMAKHTVSIYDMVAGVDNGATYPLPLWEEKIKDHINYLLLLWALVNERKGDANENANY